MKRFRFLCFGISFSNSFHSKIICQRFLLLIAVWISSFNFLSLSWLSSNLPLSWSYVPQHWQPIDFSGEGLKEHWLLLFGNWRGAISGTTHTPFFLSIRKGIFPVCLYSRQCVCPVKHLQDSCQTYSFLDRFRARGILYGHCTIKDIGWKVVKILFVMLPFCAPSCKIAMQPVKTIASFPEPELHSTGNVLGCELVEVIRKPNQLSLGKSKYVSWGSSPNPVLCRQLKGVCKVRWTIKAAIWWKSCLMT